ncbi:MAG: LOG family protein [Bacteroidetes bacterium]|nr:LOG family protein [Bacteroidota bacterium]
MKTKNTRVVKGYNNSAFMNSSSARPIRILSEFVEPLSRFQHYKIHSTVVFFGSARIKSKFEINRLIRKNETAYFKKQLSHKEYVNQKKRFKKLLDLSKYYDDAVELARLITEWSLSLPEEKRIFVCSGGGPGIMEASNKGAKIAKGNSIGLNISLPHEQNPNKYISSHLNFEFHYFFMRKYWFMYLGKALIAFPGGFGTIDEMMELLTLSQTKKIKKKIFVILYGKEFWDKIINFDELLNLELISKKDLELFNYANSPQEAFNKLKTSLIKNYPKYFKNE